MKRKTVFWVHGLVHSSHQCMELSPSHYQSQLYNVASLPGADDMQTATGTEPSFLLMQEHSTNSWVYSMASEGLDFLKTK